MKRTAQDILNFVEDNDVKFVKLTFCDIFGNQKNVSLFASELPRAFEQGIIAAESIAGLDPKPLDEDTIPQIVFSNPEAASVGLTATDAKQRDDLSDIKETVYPMMSNARMMMSDSGGSLSLVSGIRAQQPGVRVVLGVHMVAPVASDIIAEAEQLVGKQNGNRRCNAQEHAAEPAGPAALVGQRGAGGQVDQRGSRGRHAVELVAGCIGQHPVKGDRKAKVRQAAVRVVQKDRAAAAQHVRAQGKPVVRNDAYLVKRFFAEGPEVRNVVRPERLPGRLEQGR